jgi:hypothetical protein
LIDGYCFTWGKVSQAAAAASILFSKQAGAFKVTNNSKLHQLQVSR